MYDFYRFDKEKDSYLLSYVLSILICSSINEVYIFPINSKEHSALKDNVKLICFWFFSRVLNSRLNCLSWKINHALQESLLNKIVFLPRDSKNLSYTICGFSYRKMFFCIIRGHQVAFVRYNHINTILIYGFAMLWASTTSILKRNNDYEIKLMILS